MLDKQISGLGFQPSDHDKVIGQKHDFMTLNKCKMNILKNLTWYDVDFPILLVESCSKLVIYVTEHVLLQRLPAYYKI